MLKDKLFIKVKEKKVTEKTNYTSTKMKKIKKV